MWPTEGRAVSTMNGANQTDPARQPSNMIGQFRPHSESCLENTRFFVFLGLFVLLVLNQSGAGAPELSRATCDGSIGSCRRRLGVVILGGHLSGASKNSTKMQQKRPFFVHFESRGLRKGRLAVLPSRKVDSYHTAVTLPQSTVSKNRNLSDSHHTPLVVPN